MCLHVSINWEKVWFKGHLLIPLHCPRNTTYQRVLDLDPVWNRNNQADRIPIWWIYKWPITTNVYINFSIIDIILGNLRRRIRRFINTENVFYNHVFLLKLFSFLCCHNVKYNICFYQHTTKIYSKLSETGNTLWLRLTFTFIWYCCLLDVYKYKIDFCSKCKAIKNIYKSLRSLPISANRT